MNSSPFTPPPGFFDEQRKEVLRAVRRRVQWSRMAAAAAAALAILGGAATILSSEKDEACTSYACLLEATPADDLPVQWALEELSGDAAWTDLLPTHETDF